MFLSNRFKGRCCAVLLILFTFSGGVALRAQSRLNDRDIEALMKNLKEDSKSFRSEFDEAVKKSAIRKTSQEKDARNLVESFERQADGMLNEFKKSKKGDVAVESTLSCAQEVSHMLGNLPLDARIVDRWNRIQTELAAVSSGFGINVSHRRI